MPLFNINELQNLEDLKYLSQLSDQQQIQALANLGQRLGIKGDSVAYGSFTFLDLLDNNYIPNADNEPEIGILNYYLHPGKNCVFSEIGTTTTDERYVHDKKPLNNLLTKHNEENVFYQQFFLNNLELETKINNIEYYNANSIFNKDGNILKVLLFGKLMGMNDNENNNIEIQYNEFDLASNELKRGIRTYYGYSLNANEHYYILLDFVRCHDEDGENDYKDYYDLSVYILNSKDVAEDLNIDITALYKLDNIDTNEDFANVAEKYVNILGKKYFNEYNLFNLFMDRGYSAKYKNMKIKFDVAENKLLMNESNENLKYIESILVNTSEISIYNRIDYVNIDIEYLYPQIFAYYDHHSYKLNKGVLYKHIMFSLYEKLLSEYDIDASYIDEFPVMYIPLDQKIYYLHNKENEFIVYFSNDVHVNKIDFSTYTPSKIKEILKSDTILFDYSCVHSNDVAKTYDNKQSVYQVHVIYNDKYKPLINDINVINVYTLPYINSRNHWVVNDIDTNVIAKAAVTNDQTLLLIHNYYDESSDKFSCNIISNINNNEIFERSLEHQDIIDVELDESRLLKCYLPKLDDDNYEYFKDILLILISDSSCIFKNDTTIGHDDNKMCTFWQTTIDDNGNMSFKILRIDDNDILDGKNIFNFDELKTWFKQNIDMENNMFDQVLFNIKQTQIMNQSVEKTTQFTGKVGYEDPVTLMDLVKNLYPKFVSSAEYYNNLNMILGTYNNKGLIDGYHDEENKFIKDTKENYVTNSLYVGNKVATLNMNSVLDDNNVSTKVIGILEKLGIAQFEIDASQEIKTYKLADILEEEFVSIMAIQEQIDRINEEVISETPELYREFDFNYNVPEIDIKEFILKNINILNRMNILSLDKNGNLYNAFLGTDFNNENKNELLLTSIPTNINIGQNTLIDPKCTTRFNTHDTLRILFNKIILEGNEIVFGKNIQTYEHPSTGLYKYEDPSANKEWLKPHTIHINSIIEPLYDLLITTVNNNEDDAYFIPENDTIENPQYFVKVEPQRLFNYSNEVGHISKLFYEFVEHHIYEGTFDTDHMQNDEPMRFSDSIIGNANSSSIASEAKFKLIVNWSYLLRQYGIIDMYTVVDSIWYNNKRCTPKSFDALDSSFVYNEENFTYNGEILWIDSSKHQDKNPNIISFLDEDDYILMRKENPETLFSNNTTVILNTEINITYWVVSEEEDIAGVKTKHICLCINDGGLGAKASNIRLHWENEISHS